MKLSNAKRKYLADVLAKTAEYVLSIVVLGQIISGKVHLFVTIPALGVFIVLAIVGTIITPDKEVDE